MRRIIMEEYNYVDCFDKYDRIMQFNKNKKQYLHGWYPFVEGYSKEFIRSIINELDYIPIHCVEPFAGSGTTAVELQKYNIKCTSFEVNPFMYNLAKSKMRTDYTTNSFKKNLQLLQNSLLNTVSKIEEVYPPPVYTSIMEREELDKWIFDLEVMRGLLDIKHAIKNIKNQKYSNLLKIALASLLLDISNVYRNGKCLSYKKKWKEKENLKREDVHDLFLEKATNIIYPDIKLMNKYKKESGKLFSNSRNVILGDCRQNINKLEDNSVDLVITSPPYLNSRDYTDTYMIELWMLDLVRNYQELKELRRKTIRSHVQVVWGNVPSLEINELKNAILNLQKHKEKFWNKNLLEMIKGYFLDMDILFKGLSKKVKNSGKVYFNVANSAYYGVEIETDKIIATIASNHGFQVQEIRKARKINPSSQQKDRIPFLLEVVIVMTKKERKDIN
jgi:DNA modification methylase